MDHAELRFHRELQVRLGELLESETASLSQGYAVSFEDYRHRVGRLEALREALSIAIEIERKVSGRITDRG